jgi:hypothetical protein
MTHGRSSGLTLLGAILIGAAGCEASVPATGSRAIVPADHLEQQRAKLKQMTANIKPQPNSKLRSNQ